MILRTPLDADTHATLPPEGAAASSDGNDALITWSMVKGACCAAAHAVAAKMQTNRMNSEYPTLDGQRPFNAETQRTQRKRRERQNACHASNIALLHLVGEVL